MSKKSRRQYPEEFKKQAIEMAQAGSKSVSQVAADLGISENLLYNWIRRLNTDPGEDVKAMRQRIAQLERENADLRMDKEILKKSMAIFAQRTSKPGIR